MSAFRKLILIACLALFTAVVVIPIPTVSATGPTTIKIVKLTSPVKRNGKATLIIQTTPSAKCHLIYRAPSGRVSTAKGLGIKYADKKGNCKWNWKISSSTKPGTGQLIITINDHTTLRKPIVIR